MLRMEFLYLGALITIAAAIQGNMLAMWIALTAVVLTFVTIRITNEGPRKNSLFSLSSSGREKKERNKNRPGRTPVIINDHGENEMKTRTQSLADRLNTSTSEMVQEAIMADRGGDGAQHTYIGCMAAAGALMPIAMILAQKKNLSREEIEENGKEEAMKLVTQDTMLLAALITSKLMVSLDPSTGQTDWEMSPLTLFEALTDWEKLTGKSADGIFDSRMLEAIRSISNDSSVPFDEFRKKRSKSIPTPKTLQ